MNELVAWKPLSLSLLSTLPEFFIDQNIFFPELSYTVSQYFITLALIAVRQEISYFESSVVVQELEFAMNLALYGLIWSLGNQYTVGSLSWRSSTFTANLYGKSFEWLLTTDFASVEVSS